MKPELKLLGENGNVFTILGLAKRVAEKNGMDWNAIQTEAMKGDYDHVLRTMMKHFEVS